MTCKRFLTVFSILCAIFTSCLVCAQQTQTVRVGLMTGIGRTTSLTVSCTAPFEVLDSSTDSVVTTVSNGSVTFVPGGKGIEIDPATALSDSKPSSKQLDPSPEDILPGSSSDAATPDDSHKCSDFPGPIRLVATRPGAIFTVGSSKHQNRRYRGVLEIEGGEVLTAIDELPLEDYIRGVIPIEVPKGFQPEAQKALVIAIRTYALTSIGGGHHRSAGFDLCDNTDCQCFAGASKDATWIDKLVDDTRGQVIVCNGALIHATYSTDCGGITRNNEDAGFGKDPWPYLRSVVDSPLTATSDRNATVQSAVATGKTTTAQAVVTDSSADYCSGDPYHAWTKEFTSEDLDRIFSRSRTTKIGKFVSMEFSDFDSSGRVKSVRVKGDTGETTITGNRFRDLVGRDGLRSTRMTLTISPGGKYVINGKGFGHGVGLCAFGANGMAKTDPRVTCFDILKHYYTGVEVRSLTGELLSKTKSAAPRQAEPIRKPNITNHGDGPARPGSVEETNPYDF